MTASRKLPVTIWLYPKDARIFERNQQHEGKVEYAPRRRCGECRHWQANPMGNYCMLGLRDVAQDGSDWCSKGEPKS